MQAAGTALALLKVESGSILNHSWETTMSTQISSKVAALAIALMMNSLIIGAVAYLFSGQIPQRSSAVSLAGATAPLAEEA
jgi:hypothetical protein